MCGGNESRPNGPLWELARRQHGVVALSQARSLGRSPDAIARLVASGKLLRRFPRTFIVAGSPATLEQRAMAAVLWAKPVAVVSHDTAAALWGFCPAAGSIHVTTPRNLTSPPGGIRCHTGLVPTRERGSLRGIPITGVGRTLLDLAGERTSDRLLPVVERAVLDGLVTHEQLWDLVERYRGRRGRRRLAETLGDAAGSALERRIESIFAGSGLPPFIREHPVGPYRLDFAWPERRVGVEADGRRWHSSSEAFARDRAKHNDLTASNWRILRVTWSDIGRPRDLVAATAELLRGS